MFRISVQSEVFLTILTSGVYMNWYVHG